MDTQMDESPVAKTLKVRQTSVDRTSVSLQQQQEEEGEEEEDGGGFF